MKPVLTITALISLLACQTKEVADATLPFDPASMKPTIIELGKQWDTMVKSQDIALIDQIYDVNAHYVVDSDSTYHGLDEIRKIWANGLSGFSSLQLKLETLEGTKEILYETGVGVSVLDFGDGPFEFPFKYVNVWKLQSDGSYKVVIDTFNDVKPQQ